MLHRQMLREEERQKEAIEMETFCFLRKLKWRRWRVHFSFKYMEKRPSWVERAYDTGERRVVY